MKFNTPHLFLILVFAVTVSISQQAVVNSVTGAGRGYTIGGDISE